MIDLMLNHLKGYLEQHVVDCTFHVGYLPGREAVAQSLADGIYITLLAITEDTSAKVPFVYSQDLDRNFTRQDPPILLEISIMVSAFFKDYTEGLKAISKVIQKLADKKKFVTNDVSYTLAMYNLTMDQSNNLWQALSTNVLPNIIYKLRYVQVHPDFDENADLIPEVIDFTLKTKKL